MEKCLSKPMIIGICVLIVLTVLCFYMKKEKKETVRVYTESSTLSQDPAADADIDLVAVSKE